MLIATHEEKILRDARKVLAKTPNADDDRLSMDLHLKGWNRRAAAAAIKRAKAMPSNAELDQMRREVFASTSSTPDPIERERTYMLRAWAVLTSRAEADR